MQKNQLTLDSILRFGDPRLNTAAQPVVDSDPQLDTDIERLTSMLHLFQSTHSWGRSIAAPQIGISKRVIAINTVDLPEVLINPEIVWHSDETQLVWDDCMSLPSIAVKVQRWRSVSVQYQAPDGGLHTLRELSPADAELLQHEIDHLDGVLMTQRMTPPIEIVARENRSPLSKARPTAPSSRPSS